MRKVIARVDEEYRCPLYHKGDELEITRTAVHSPDHLPVCLRAMISLSPNVRDVRDGESPEKHRRLFCGGCDNNRAWFSLDVETQATLTRTSPQFADFALTAMGKAKLFVGARTTVLERVLHLVKDRQAADGEAVMTRGIAGHALFIIVRGEFTVLQLDEQGVEHPLATLGPGDCFGEMSLLTGEPASATVRSKGGGWLIEIPKEQFTRLLQIVPTAAFSLAQVLAARLARASTLVIEEIRRGLIGRLDLIAPSELVQAMNVNSQSGLLTVQGENSTALVTFAEGQVVDVRIGNKSGEEAFFDFCSWTKGTFRFQPGVQKTPVAIKHDTIGLLLEGMRRIDETLRRPNPPAEASALDSK